MRKKALAAAAAVLALGVAACGAPSPNAANNATPQASTAPKADKFSVIVDKDAKGPAPEVSGAQKGGTVSVITSVVPTKFDPTQAYYIDALAILRLTTRGLTELAIQDDGRYHLMPDLATDLGQVSDDKLSWTFHIKPGMKYEDGSPVKAQDFAYAIARSFATEELPGGPLYQLSYFLDGDKYKGPYKDKTPYTGVETPDDSTVVIKLAKPFGDLPYYLTFPAMSPIPEAKDTKSNYGLHPVASGPYKFEKYEQGKSVSLVKNDQWDAASDPGRHQYADGFNFSFGLDPLTVQKRMVADQGQDKTAITYDAVDASLMPDIRGKEPEGRLVTGGGTCVDFTYFDMRAWKDKRIREAYYQAYPFDLIHKAAQETTLTYQPGTTIDPPVTPGWVNYDVSGTGGKGSGDPVAAKKLLTEANAVGFEIKTIVRNDNPISANVSAVRKKAMEDAGFKYTVQSVSPEKVRDITEDPKADINVRGGGWCLDWPSGGTVFPAILDGRLIAQNPTAAPNKSFFNEPKVNSEIDRISALPADQQPAEWAALDKMITTDYLPIMPVDYSKNAYLHGSKIGGSIMDIYAGGPDFTKLFVKQ
jgi:peptide/nickel transport system substrate-binding protein